MLILANLIAVAYTLIVAYVFIGYIDYKFHVSLDIARDLANAEPR